VLLLPEAKDDSEGEANVAYRGTIRANAAVIPLRAQSDFAAPAERNVKSAAEAA
jgi:hypothetical protein